MNPFLHLLETLESHIDHIRMDLGTDWPEFATRVQSLAPVFETAHDQVELARAMGGLYRACRTREPVMTILCQMADTSGAGHVRRFTEGRAGNGNTMPVREIVNRFQLLLDRLEETERSEEGQDRWRPDTNQSRGENADDR